MATKKTTNVTTTTSIFAEPETFNEVVEEVVTDEPVIVAPGAPASKKGRVKGTWLMHWGTERFDFEDGKVYTLPSDLYDYLVAHGNIYDTL
jgi:hypothetical protein